MPASTATVSTEKIGVPATPQTYASAVVAPLKTLNAENPSLFSMHQYGVSAEGQPLFMLQTQRNPANPTILIVSGTHGDEPQAVMAVIEFLRRELPAKLRAFNFIIYPCINPDGLDRDTRANAGAVDLNRAFFADSRVQECRAFIDSMHLWSAKPACLLNLHEDCPDVISDFGDPDSYPNGLYLYETTNDSKLRIAEKVLRALAGKIQASSQTELYGDQLRGGVIRYGPDSMNSAKGEIKDLDRFLTPASIPLAITIETPEVWQAERRMGAQVAVVSGLLDEMKQNIRRTNARSIMPADTEAPVLQAA